MTLPKPSGPYSVGWTTFSRSVPKQRFGSSKIVRYVKAGAEPALVMEEVMYNVYYPADTSTKGKRYEQLPWCLR